MAYANPRAPLARPLGLGRLSPPERRRIYWNTAAGDTWTRIVTTQGSKTFTIKPRTHAIAAQIRAALENTNALSTGWLTGEWGDDYTIGETSERDPDFGFVKPSAFEPEAAVAPAFPIEKYGTLDIPCTGDQVLRFTVRESGAADYMRSYQVLGPVTPALLALIPPSVNCGYALITLRLTGVFSINGGASVQAVSFRDAVSVLGDEPLEPGTPGTTTIPAGETGREDDTVLPDWAAEAARDAVENRGASWEPPDPSEGWWIADGCGVPRAFQGSILTTSGGLLSGVETPEALDCLIRSLELTAEKRGTSFEAEFTRLLQGFVDSAASSGTRTEKLAAWAALVRERAGGVGGPAGPLTAGGALLPALLFGGAFLYLMKGRKGRR